MKVDGACACGAIRIEAEADPENTNMCHCTDCQTATGTAFRVSVRVQGAMLKITGKPAIYVKTTAESGNPRVQARRTKTGSGKILQRVSHPSLHARSRVKIQTVRRSDGAGLTALIVAIRHR